MVPPMFTIEKDCLKTHLNPSRKSSIVTNADRRHSLNLSNTPSSSSLTLTLCPLSNRTLSLVIKISYSSHQRDIYKVTQKFILLFFGLSIRVLPNLKQLKYYATVAFVPDKVLLQDD